MHRLVPLFLGALLATITLVGCVGEEATRAGVIDDVSRTQDEQTVVAVIDTGVNPFHEAFAANWDAEVATFFTGQSPALVRRGTQGAAFETGVLYRFEGTRVLGVAFSDKVPTLVRDWQGHGTATASLVAREAPGAWIVAVQVNPQLCVGQTRADCVVDESVAAAMEWVAAQDWIDVVSISMNSPGGKPDLRTLEPEAERFIAASRAASEAGKLIVNSAGNYPTASLGDYFAGVPWVITVGAGQAAKHGVGLQNTKGFDVLANSTEYVAALDNDTAYRWTSGTSLGAPIVAGVLADALASVEFDDKIERRVALRDALNATSSLWGPTEWDPMNRSQPDPVFDVLEATAPVVAGPAQSGWGFVDGATSQLMKASLRGESVDEKPDEYARVMAAYQSARESYWGAR